MAATANCCMREYRRLSTRNYGLSVVPDWLRAVDVSVGDTIGIDRTTTDGGERCFVLRLTDYDVDRVDFEVKVRDQNGSCIISVPKLVAEWAALERGERVYFERSVDGREGRVQDTQQLRLKP
jgi:hypothetical protein